MADLDTLWWVLLVVGTIMLLFSVIRHRRARRAGRPLMWYEGNPAGALSFIFLVVAQLLMERTVLFALAMTAAMGCLVLDIVLTVRARRRAQ